MYAVFNCLLEFHVCCVCSVQLLIGVPCMLCMQCSIAYWSSMYVMYAVFNYLPEFHSVVEVRKEDYERCKADDAIAEHKDGNTSIELQRVGSYYYICGTNKHCPLGQKLKIKVLIPPQDEDTEDKHHLLHLVSSPCHNLSFITPSPSPSPLPPSLPPLSSSSSSSSSLSCMYPHSLCFVQFIHSLFSFVLLQSPVFFSFF